MLSSKVFAIFTEKETVKEELKDNLDVILQRFTEDCVENTGDAIGWKELWEVTLIAHRAEMERQRY